MGDLAAGDVVVDGEGEAGVQKGRDAGAGAGAVADADAETDAETGAGADAETGADAGAADAAVGDDAAEDAAVAVAAAAPVAGVVGIEAHRMEGRLEVAGWCEVVEEVAAFVAYKENGVEVVPGEAVGVVTAVGHPAG